MQPPINSRKWTLAILCIEFCLLMLGFFARRQPQFFDHIRQQDVTSQYESTLSAFRYLLEPFSGLAFSLFTNRLAEVVGGLILAYVIFRLIYRLFKRKAHPFSPCQQAWYTALYWYGVVFGLLSMSVLLYIWLAPKFWGADIIFQHGLNWIIYSIYGCWLVWLLVFIGKLLWSMQGYVDQIPPVNLKDPFHWIKGLGYLLLELRLFVCTLFFWIGLNWLMVSVPWPTQTFNLPSRSGEFLIDFHSHTSFSDGLLSPKQRVDWYRNQGIHGAAISDHNTTRGAQAAAAHALENNLPFLVFISQEFSNENPHLHMNLFLTETNLTPLEYQNPISKATFVSIKQAIDYVHQQGGLAIVNHYNGQAEVELEQLNQWGVDGYEIWNSARSMQDTTVRAWCLEQSLICISGSDEPNNRELRTFVRVALGQNAKLDLPSALNAIRNQRHQVVTVDYTSRKIAWADWGNNYFLAPWGRLLHYFWNINRIQILSWMLWLALFSYSWQRIWHIAPRSKAR